MIEEHEQLIVFMMIAGKQSGNGTNLGRSSEHGHQPAHAD